MLPYLCVEILQEIGSQLPNSDQKNLRAVCKDLGLAIDPLFYTFFVLRGDRLRQENGLYIIERLATRQIGWVHHAKTVHITPGSRPEGTEAKIGGPKWYPSDAALPDLLVSALASMQNIQTVVWTVHPRDPDWVKKSIADSLNTLPFLSDLQLKIDGGSRIALSPMPALTKLSMEAISWQPAHVQMVQDICRVVGRTHNLASLRLSGAGDYSKVWTLLRAMLLRPAPHTRVHLTALTTSFVTADLLAYLSSYSNVLQRITLEPPHSHIHGPGLADTFFDTVLPAHASSLRAVSVPGGAYGRWTFGLHNVEAVLALRKLQTLHLTVHSREGGDTEGVNAVALLLSTAALLPALRVLRISAAERYRGSEDAIRIAIEDYTTPVESGAVVCADAPYSPAAGQDSDRCCYYELAPAVSDEPGERSTILAYRALDPDRARARVLCAEI
ncbi:hypothetical protein B0H17DRAFT_1072182 [Mycena rosella]|uniref:F-box domain-containing protein n=1 Tax=Mycena rosella TaxID=1033263 RepID=A0AAD7D9J3_MYCRO|nr:hypothetical protein B0H17DRAFT_1072182 [Mycena rosella]